MKIDPIVKPLSDTCTLCGGMIDSALDLQNLPFTGIYGTYHPDSKNWAMNQSLMLCRSCGHGQLKSQLDLSFLYGNTYSYRTSKSATGRSGVEFLLNYMEQLFPGKKFSRIVDFGCNDGHLLKKLKQKGEKLLGIDLIWKDREKDFQDDRITVLGQPIEQINLWQEMGGSPDLVVSQHTIEHIADPRSLLSYMHAAAGEDTVFLFEFPCFNLLLENFRIDQLSHEHLQYFSLHSFMKLLSDQGFNLIDYTFNYHHWGAILVAFKKSKKKAGRIYVREHHRAKVSPDDVTACYRVFQRQMDCTGNVLKKCDSGKLWGYGASLMLPVLGYHLKTDFSQFVAILDDDPLKHGSGYVNLPVKIKEPKDMDFSEATICLTAMDNRRPILKHLVSRMPIRIITPLNTL